MAHCNNKTRLPRSIVHLHLLTILRQGNYHAPLGEWSTSNCCQWPLSEGEPSIESEMSSHLSTTVLECTLPFLTGHFLIVPPTWFNQRGASLFLPHCCTKGALFSFYVTILHSFAFKCSRSIFNYTLKCDVQQCSRAVL